MKVLVTGATGLLGSCLTKILIERGHSVTCLIRDGVPKANFYRLGLEGKVVTVRGELENFNTVMRTFNEYEIEICFHLGAQTQIGIGNRSPLSTFEANIKGSWNVLEAARQHRPLKRLLFASSDKAYGAHDKLPYTEDAPLQGSHPYDVSKSCADLLAQSYLATYKLPVAIARCANLYGGGDFNWNRIVPGTIRSLLEESAPIIRSDGKMIRDYMYVVDGALGYLALAESDLTGAFNFGTDTPTSVLDMVREILRIMKSPLEPVIKNEAQNEIPRQWLSSEKARSLLGWTPKFELWAGLTETIEWYRQNQDVWKS